MPGGYGTYGPWGSAGTTAPSGAYEGPHDTNEGPNTVADVVNAFQSAPPQLSFTPDLQNQAQLAIAAQNPPPPTTVYEDVFEPYDLDQDMATGFGSVFGASSGSTGSSQTVQDALTFMIDQNVQEIADDQGYTTSSDINNAINAAYSNFYPQIDQMTLEEFLAAGGTEADYIAANAAMYPGSANLMAEIPEGQIDIGDQYYNNWLNSQNYNWDSWTDPWYEGHKQSVGPAGMTLAELARHTWFSESLADVERREQERLEAGLDVATMSNMEQMYGPHFAADANPFFDPKFSESATAEMNPLAADITLFEQARS